MNKTTIGIVSALVIAGGMTLTTFESTPDAVFEPVQTFVRYQKVNDSTIRVIETTIITTDFDVSEIKNKIDELTERMKDVPQPELVVQHRDRLLEQLKEASINNVDDANVALTDLETKGITLTNEITK